MLPNFLCIGAAKSGTSWLHVCLEEHPDICIPVRMKETNFFAENYEKGFSWYESLFDHYCGETAVGEVSPNYMARPVAAKRIYLWNPDVRLICLLRNPIERAYSHYCMRLRAGTASEDLDSEIMPGSFYVNYGLYFRQISLFLEFFSKTQVGIFLYDDLKQDPRRFLSEIYSFLDVNASFEPRVLYRAYGARKNPPRFKRLYKMLVRATEFTLLNFSSAKKAIENARRCGYFNIIHRLNRGRNFPLMSMRKKGELAELFKNDIAGLSRLLKRDLDHWVVPYHEAM